MNIDRATDIFNSLDKIEVFHNGKPVWITELHSISNSAKVKDMTTSTAEKEVPVNELTEGGMIR